VVGLSNTNSRSSAQCGSCLRAKDDETRGHAPKEPLSGIAGKQRCHGHIGEANFLIQPSSKDDVYSRLIKWLSTCDGSERLGPEAPLCLAMAVYGDVLLRKVDHGSQ